MKTNNRLSKDNNTHEPKVRPMVKETYGKGIHNVSGSEFYGTDYQVSFQNKRWFNAYTKTTESKVVERPMNETEYIDYLEKENNELKGRIALQQSSYEKKFRELNDKLLKVVESVLDGHVDMDFNNCSSCGAYDEDLTYREHLLQEIKSAIQKDL